MNAILGIPPEFVLFAATLLGVAILHHRTFTVAVALEARIADLKGDASTAQLTREALRREIRSGPPHPFWERRLSAP